MHTEDLPRAASQLALIATASLLSLATGQECRILSLTPVQPPLQMEEGELALESPTFQTGVFALSTENVPYFVDTLGRIRRIDPNGRITTVAGNGRRADFLTPGPALDTGLPGIGQLAVSPSGILHFTATGRVYRVVGADIEVAAGSGRPGFNGESGPASEVNLGGIANIAFTQSGSLLILDGFNRLRRLEIDGTIQTIAGSTRVAAANGQTGDGDRATQAALSNPRQVVPLGDGSIWIKDLAGRNIRLLTPDGIIRTVNTNFEPAVNILLLPGGTPAAATDNRVYRILPDGNIETGSNPFYPYTGTPRAIGSDGTLYFQGSTRPDQQNPLIRMDAKGAQTVIGGAPVPPVVDGRAAPYGVWLARNNSLLYAASQAGKSGIFEVRPGQAPRFIVGGGDDIGDGDGKNATELRIFGIAAFTVDGEGRIVVGDVNRRRVLAIGADGKTSVLKNEAGQPIPYSALGSLSSLQRIAADQAGNIYWFSRGETPPGGVFSADISVWNRATASVNTFNISGLAALTRRGNGNAAVIAGNATAFRTLYDISPGGQGDPHPTLRMLPLQAIAEWQGQPYFVAAARLFRGEPGSIEFFDVPALPNGASFVPDYVLGGGDVLFVHLSDGGFYRVDNVDACRWTRQPAIQPGGIVNAANYEYANTVSPRALLSIFGSGLGPAGGRGLILDGALRAGAQSAPYPALQLGNFSGTIPLAALSGTSLPVVYSDDVQATVEAPSANPSSGEYLLYFSWQGLQLIHPEPIRAVDASPGLFTNGTPSGLTMALNADGTKNGPNNPAPTGSVVQLFGTGFGTTHPNLGTGFFWPTDSLSPVVNAVTVSVGGVGADIEFAGGAQGMFGGVYQINVVVPAELPPGEQEIAIGVNGQPAPPAQRARIVVQ